MQAALALPILVLPARAGAAEVSEIGFTLLGYQERGLMKVSEPIVWAKGRIGDGWEIQASALIDIVTGASPEGTSNVSGRPVQVISGASVTDRRRMGDVKIARRIGELTLAGSGAWSSEEDYFSRAFGFEARLDLNQRNTTLAAGYGHSSDRVGSSDAPLLNEPRTTREYMLGITQVLTRTSAVQSTVTRGRGRGWYSDPYRYTLTFFPEQGLEPIFARDARPHSRGTWSWLTRYRKHFPDTDGTLQADYRYYSDDWGIRAHTIEAAWQQELSERWSLRPALRYYTQRAARFYAPVVPLPQPDTISSDQRLASFGGLSPSLRAILRLENGVTIEATAGYVYDAARLRAGGSGSSAYETLRAYYGILTVSRAF
jgi:hypothetical protein